MYKKIFILGEVDSTNDYAFRLKDKYSPPFVLISLTQTKGKGREGNYWFSPNGGLWVSFLFDNVDVLRARGVTLFCSLVIKEFFKKFYQIPLFIKLPNDLILSGKKVGGVLAEFRDEILVIGIGLNTNVEEFPQQLIGKATSILLETKKFIPHLPLVEFLFESLSDLLKSSRRDWLRRLEPENLWGYKKYVEFRFNQELKRGILMGLNEKFEVLISQDVNLFSYPLDFIKDFTVLENLEEIP